jgi:hypothetical protein
MIAATLHGPGYTLPNYNERTIEVFPDLESVIVALIERHHTEGRTAMNYRLLDGRNCVGQWPGVLAGTYFECYEVAGPLGDAPPTEDQVMDALTDIHSGVWTWRLTLARIANPAGFRMSVMVEANR